MVLAKAKYDEKFDALYIYREGKAKFSIEIEDHVVDIGSNEKIVGIEIFNASKVLDVSKKMLKQIKLAKLSSFIKNNKLLALYSIKLPKQKIENKITVYPVVAS